MSKANKKPAAGETAAQPLFFVDPHPIDAARHKEAGLNAKAGFRFAAGSNSLPLTMHEFVEAARSYPIVFTPEPTPMPLAVVGLKRANCFVGKTGEWLAGHYVPAYARKYPFALIELPQQKQFMLCMDEASEHFQAKKADLPLFGKDGKPTELSQQAIELCSQYHSQHHATKAFGNALKSAGLLEPQDMQATLASGEKVNLGGFLMISEEKWNKMPDKQLLEWNKNGWLGLVYLAMASQVNWKYLAALEVKR